jgi:hypothetical protein
VAAATFVAFVALVALWPRLAGRDAGHIAARAGLLLGVNVLVLLTAATLLNAQFLFFADWADLGGAVGGGTATTSLARGASASSAPTKAASSAVPQAVQQAGCRPSPPGWARTASPRTH